MLYAADSGKVYYCGADGKWETLNGAEGEQGGDGKNGESCTAVALADGSGFSVICGGDTVGTILNGSKGDEGDAGESCTAEMLEDSSGYKIVCGGDSVGVVLNGAKGKQGAKGETGKAGESCTAVALADSSGFSVICGADTVGTILNGAKGEKGDTGESCTLSDAGNGKVTVTCGESSVTLYKAMCGSVPYDPEKSLCKNEKIYSCNETPYDPSESFCFGRTGVADTIVTLCGGNEYNVTDSICYKGVTVSRVVAVYFNPEFLAAETYGTFTDSRDGQVYLTIDIGSQTWMAQNLNYAATDVSVYVNSKWSSCLDNEESSCTKYGRLYGGRIREKVCPSGWHLPSEDEWVQLLSDRTVSGFTSASIEGGANSYGFSSIPTGYRDSEFNYSQPSAAAYYWSSTNSSESNKPRMLTLKAGSISWVDQYYTHGRSIRCVKD